MSDKVNKEPVKSKTFVGQVVEDFYYKKKKYYSSSKFKTSDEKLFQHLLTTKRIIK
jgi:hypothetical protein